jgi:hypothetical protein
MTEVRETVSLNASPADLWSVVGGFDNVDSWHPAIADCETTQDGEELVRHLTLADGSKVVEQLDSHDDNAKTYVYSILDAGPLPIQNYQAKIEVSGGGSESTLTWSSQFDPDGVPDAEAQAAISGVYTSGFAALIERFGAA